MAIRARFPFFVALVLSVVIHATFFGLSVRNEGAATRTWQPSTTVSISIEATTRHSSTETPLDTAAAPRERAPAQPLPDSEKVATTMGASYRESAPQQTDTRSAPNVAPDAAPDTAPDTAMGAATRLSRGALIEAIAAAVPAPTERRRFTASSRNDPASAYYLAALARELHRVGALNYPQAAKRDGLSGSLVIAIAIRHDGRLDEVRTVTSSGHDVLDEAALDIVRLAAPFTPPPAAMSANAETIEVIHTWHFTRRSI